MIQKILTVVLPMVYWGLLFLAPAAPLLKRTNGTWGFRLAFIAFVSSCLLAVEYALSGLLFGVAITVDLTLLFSCINCSIFFFLTRRPDPPLVDATSKMHKKSQSIMYCLVALSTACVVVTSMPSFFDRTPSISDNISRFNFVFSLEHTGIPPHHWLQEQAVMQYYFYFFVPIAAYGEFLGKYLDLPRIYSVYLVLNTLMLNTLLAALVMRLSSRLRVSLVVFTALSFGSSFSFPLALLTKLRFHYNWAQSLLLWAEKMGWKSDIFVIQPIIRSMWLPHDHAAIVAILLALTIHMRVFGNSHSGNRMLTILLLVFALGAQTYFLFPLAAGMGAWIWNCLARRDWPNVRSCMIVSCGTLLLTLPYLHYLSTRSSLISLGLPRAQISLLGQTLQGPPGFDNLSGLIFYWFYVAVEFGVSTYFLYYLWRANSQKPLAGLPCFALFGSASMILAMGCIQFNGPRNDLSARGLALASAVSALGFLVINQREGYRAREVCPPSWVWIFSMLPPFISFVGMVHFCTVVPKIDPLTLWANRNLPANALVLIDESFFSKIPKSPLEADYTRTAFEMIERQRWLRLSRIHPADQGIVDVSKCLEAMPESVKHQQPQYLLAAKGYLPMNLLSSIVYQDDTYVLIRLPRSIAPISAF